jgi:hypothetical protein
MASGAGAAPPPSSPGDVGSAGTCGPDGAPERTDPSSAASPGAAELAHCVLDLVAEGVLPVGLDAGDRPVADVASLLRSLTQVEAVLGLRMATAEGAGALPFLTAGGMASHASWSRSRARALSRAGHLASDRPEIAEAWLAGRVTAEHIDAAARGVTGLPPDRAAAILDGLVGLWGQVTPSAVSTYCARARAIVDPAPDDEDLRAQKAHVARFLSFSTLDDTVHITGCLARLDGELLMNAIRITAERQRVAGDGLTASQRRADALMQMAAQSVGEGSGSGSPAVLSVTVTTGIDAVTEAGHLLSPSETRFALCDPAVSVVVTDGAASRGSAYAQDTPSSQVGAGVPRPRASAGPAAAIPTIDLRRLALLTSRTLVAPQPLAVGRTQRIATTAQRRALAARDSGCILPGCEVPAAHCQVHHLEPWTSGGRTDLPNLVSLCWAHHRQVDLGRWDIHPIESGQPGTPANRGAPFTISIRRRARWRPAPMPA